jgi:hypothetical protein
MPKLLSLRENWTFVLSVNLYVKTKNSGNGKSSGVLEKFEIAVIFVQLAERPPQDLATLTPASERCAHFSHCIPNIHGIRLNPNPRGVWMKRSILF